MKGQNSRSGGGVRPGFEGGQLPLIKSLPSHRGFTNIFREQYTVVNIDRLAAFPDGSEVTLGTLVDAGVVKGLKERVKVLGRGELDRALTVEVHRFSKAAREKIEAAGGVARETA
jgi:large subunit ribosomal protein L15